MTITLSMASIMTHPGRLNMRMNWQKVSKSKAVVNNITKDFLQGISIDSH